MKSKLDTFVADCLRIIAERRRRELADAREKALREILNQERNQLP